MREIEIEEWMENNGFTLKQGFAWCRELDNGVTVMVGPTLDNLGVGVSIRHSDMDGTLVIGSDIDSDSLSAAIDFAGTSRFIPD